MGELDESLEVNRRSWDARVPVHAASRFYDLTSFKAGGRRLGRRETEWAGDVEGRRLLHLMCHFGIDTMNWSRLGAEAVGVDFSPAAIARAQDLATELGLATRFVESNVLDLDLGERFDIVFTSWGILPWLPDLEAWAATIRRHLEPGGRFLMFEFHPQASVFGPDLAFAYPYFDPGSVRERHGTYTDAPPDFETETVQWQHSTAAVITALLTAGLRLTRFEEFEDASWKRFQDMERTPQGGWRLPRPWFPIAFGLEAVLDG